MLVAGYWRSSGLASNVDEHAPSDQDPNRVQAEAGGEAVLVQEMRTAVAVGSGEERTWGGAGLRAA